MISHEEFLTLIEDDRYSYLKESNREEIDESKICPIDTDDISELVRCLVYFNITGDMFTPRLIQIVIHNTEAFTNIEQKVLYGEDLLLECIIAGYTNFFMFYMTFFDLEANHFEEAARRGNFAIFNICLASVHDYDVKRLSYNAACGEQLKMLEYIDQLGLQLDDRIIEIGAMLKNMELVKFGVKKHCLLSGYCLINALVKEDNDEILYYLIKSGCPCDCYVVDKANEVRNYRFMHFIVSERHCQVGDILNVTKYEELKYLYYNGGKLTNKTFVSAIRAKDYKSLNFLLKHSCPHEDFWWAACGDLEMVTWLHEHEIDLEQNVLLYAINHENFDVFTYALNNGCRVTHEVLEHLDYVARYVNGLDPFIEYVTRR